MERRGSVAKNMLYCLFWKLRERKKYRVNKKNVIRLPQKGDLWYCNNYRGIMPMSVPGKVLIRNLLERLMEAIEPMFFDQQTGDCENPLELQTPLLQVMRTTHSAKGIYPWPCGTYAFHFIPLTCDINAEVRGQSNPWLYCWSTHINKGLQQCRHWRRRPGAGEQPELNQWCPYWLERLLTLWGLICTVTILKQSCFMTSGKMW